MAQTSEATYEIHYKTSDSPTASWVEFDPVGGTFLKFTAKEGRGVSTSATLAASYKLTWVCDTPSEFQVFDVLRAGLPLRVRITHSGTGSPTSFVGWVSEAPVENLAALTVTVSGTDGVGKLGRININDFVRDELDANWNVRSYWPMNESDGTQIWPQIMNVSGWGGVPGGWYRDAAQHQAAPLRPALNQSVQMSKTYPTQSFTFPTDTDIDQTHEHTLAARFELTDTDAVERLLFGLTNLAGDVDTVGLRVNNGVVSVRHGSGTGERNAASFTATVGTVYVAALSYAIQAPDFSVRWRISEADTGTSVLSGGTTWITAPGGTFTILQGGQVDAIVGDMLILDDGLFNLNMDRLILDMAGLAGSKTSEHLEAVCDYLEIGVESVAAKGETIEGPLGEMSTVGQWMRELEALEQGAIWWDSDAAEFRFETLAELQAASPVKQFDETAGDYTSYTAGSRIWGPVRNDVTVSAPSGLEYHTADADSVAEFGLHSVTVNTPQVDRNVLSSTAGRVLELYKTPRRYHPALSVDMAAADDWDLLESPALFDKINVSWPDGAANHVTVIGRTFEMSAGVDSAVVRFMVADMTEATGAAPTVTAIPTVSGTPSPGQTLTATTGTWTDSLRETGQWQISFDGGTTVANLGGADGMESTIVLGNRHSGGLIRRREGAWNGVGPTVFTNSDWTEAVGSSGLAPNTPAAPTVTPAGSGELDIDWVAPTVPVGGASIFTYEVRWVLGATTTNPGPLGLVLTYLATGLTIGSEYSVSVRAGSTDGWSSWSTATLATPTGSLYTVPGKPTNFQFDPIEVDGTITFSWTAPYNGGTPITGISLERGATEGATVATQAVPPGSTTFTVNGIPLGDSYWRVVYTNSVGEGPESDDIIVDPTAPSGGFGSSTFGTAPFGG